MTKRSIGSTTPTTNHRPSKTYAVEKYPTLTTSTATTNNAITNLNHPNKTTTKPTANGGSPSSSSTTTVRLLATMPKRNLAKTQSLDIVDEDLNEGGASTASAAGTSASNSSLNLSPGRSIYPNVPYSPYGSPFGSPRGRKRQPFRESRRVSVEQTETFMQLNQYKLYDEIGQVIN